MADVPISGLTALGAAPAVGDLLGVVDISDTTQAPTGTTKKMTTANLFTSPIVTSGLTVSSGTTAVQALTATTGSFASTLTMQGAGVSVQWHNAGNEDWFANSPAATTNLIFSNSTNGTCVTLTNAGALTLRAGLSATTGAFSSTLAATGDFAVNTNKFTVAAASGNTAVAGTLGVTGDVTIGASKLTVAAASGNTAVAGTLAVTGVLTATTNINTSGGVYQVAGTQVVGARSTGWATQGGAASASKGDMGAIGTWTTNSLGALLLAHHAALVAHGLIGA